MLGLVNKAYLLILLYTGFLVYEAYTEVDVEKESLVAEASSIQQQVVKKKKLLRELQGYQKDIEAKKEEVEIVAQKLEESQKKLPRNISDTQSIELIKKIAESLKIKEVNIQPSGDEESGFYITKYYSFTGKGTYLQFLLLLENISKQERILNVSDVQLSKITKVNKSRYEIINLSATIESYVYNPSHREERGFEQIEQSVKEEQERKKKEARLKRKNNRRKKR